jgi:hypothetical protein
MRPGGGSSDSGDDPWMGSAGPWMDSLGLSMGFPFLFFYLIYRGGRPTATVKAGFTVTF